MDSMELNGVTSYLDAYYDILHEMERRMTAAALSDSISRDFITQMIPHHRAAVEMCENLLRHPVEAPLASLAGTIIEQQTRGIAEMEAILRLCGGVRNGAGELCRYRRRDREVLERMFSAMAHASGVGVAQNFLREMIPHHQGAVGMSQNALRFCLCRPLRPILRGIIAVQEREIGQMRSMLAEMEEGDQASPAGSLV